MNREIREVIEAANKGTQAFRQWLAGHPDKLTPELALQMRDVFKEALNSRNGDLAELAAMLASTLYLYLGRKYDSLYNYLDYCQVKFMRADSLDAYKQLYNETHDFIDKAEEINAADLAFNGRVLSADCGFFAAQLIENDPNERDKILLAILQDLAGASADNQACSSEVWRDRFVSLLSGSLESISSLVWFDKKKSIKDKLLKQITTAVENCISVDYEFKDNTWKSVQAACNLANLSYKYGSPDAGNERLDIAIKRQEAEQSQNFEIRNELIFTRYIGSRNAGAPMEELKELRQQLYECAEQIRSQYRSRSGRLWAADSSDQILGELLLDELNSKDITPDELFYSIEASKTRLLLDFMSLKFKELTDPKLRAEVAIREREMLRFRPSDKTDLLNMEMRLASLLSIGTYWDKNERIDLLRGIEDIYNQEQVGFEGVIYPAKLQEIKKALLPDELVIEYCIPHHPLHPAKDLFLMAISNDRVETISIPLEGLHAHGLIGRLAIDGQQPLDISPIGEQVVNLRMAIQKADEKGASQLSHFFHQLLIAPVMELGFNPKDFKRWIIIPQGVLHYIPFAALLSDENKYLIEKVAIVVPPSASVWLNLLKSQLATVEGFLGLGNPDLTYTNLPDLTAAEIEVQKVAEHLRELNCEVYIHEKATEEILRDHILGKNIVHFATHGEFPEQDVIDFHKILLAPSANQDGRLNADELRNLDLNSVRLFVLSICNGGLYRFGPGDEPYGMISALFTAGVENIISTLWPLADEIGRLFMNELYKYLLSDGPAEAMRKAAIQLIEDRAFIRHWASFVLSGSGRPFN